ncbi:phosphoinositide-binding protein, putative [Plasmodium gallinaceum]|uniref:Phosphoinositide-binding protein, putative n=1 Tax=Plasmodium gallinaceum TaxID=5849 RepID=A0A1J1GZI3_PLAGA|nr:phosphoinositide-binding protein, putative [Plasmodium gallinaceum]CRG98014.1 phosphoinositide-binding protein, putative [Plasmodium gallinaceum]
MNLEEFDIGINRVDNRDEKIYYVILVKYKDLKYEVNKRYSEFEELHCELLHFGFSALPNLPKKKLLSYKNSEYISYRKNVLNSYIQGLFIRPDIRCCALFLNFLMFYDKINLSIEIVKTKLLNSIGSQKFSLSDLYINEKYNFIICVYEDKSNLSKLGKLWSIIEPDIVGEIKIFSYNNDLTSTFVEKYKEQTTYKARNIICSEKRNEVIISGDDGKIHIYKIDIELLTLTYIKNIPCHNDTILKMMQLNDNLFCTCGYDNAFRLFYLDNYKIISGGRCNKRLEKDKITTCHLLEYNNIVIGTDCSLFFIYNMSNNPPIYLDTKKLKNGEKINCFANTDKYLFIGYDNVIACYNYHYSNDSKNVKNNPIKNELLIKDNNNIKSISLTNYEYNNANYNKNYDYNNHLYKRNLNNQNISNESIATTTTTATHNNNGNNENKKYITKLVIDNNISAQYIPPLVYENNVLSLCVDKNKKVLYAGYEDAIILWSITSGLIISSFHGHTNGVHFLNFLNGSEFLLSGGNGGNLKVWKSDIDNFKIWKPKRNYKVNHVKLTNRDGYKYNVTDHNNFNFNESDNSDRGYKSSANSETISLDNLLDQTKKKHNYEIFDTSNYKKNLINNNNKSENVNSLNSSRCNIFYDKNQDAPNYLTSDMSNLDVCIITNKNDIKQNNSYDYNLYENFDKKNNFDQNIYYDCDSIQNIYSDNTSNKNTKYDCETNLNINNFNSVHQNNNYGNNFNKNPIYEKDFTKSMVYGADSQYMNPKYAPIGELHNNENTEKMDYININDINENDNSDNLKNNIVCVSDEDDDLVSAFT